MRAQQVILKYLTIVIMIVAFITAGVFFVRWLYWDNSANTALSVFGDNNQDGKIIEKYSDNLYISIINNIIPAAKISYENRYGQKMSSFYSSVYKNTFNGMNLSIKDPKTYFNFVFTAFSQYDPNVSLTALNNGGENKIPQITNFEEAPEGEIYFTEMDEYRAEEAANTDEVLVGNTGDPGGLTEDYLAIGTPERLEIEKKQPSVLILHTHSTESYMPFSSNNYHSLDENESVVQVGNIMTDVLESKYKYNVIHDKTKHDRYSYADSYINSQKTVISQLDKNKLVKVVLDVHRDAVEAKTERDAINRKSEYTVAINGKKAARIMFVIGKDNENYEELQKFAVYVQKKMDKLYPGLFYKIVTKPKRRYNQYYRDHTLLVEVGCMLNTDEEARYSAELMGNVMGEVLKELEQ